MILKMAVALDVIGALRYKEQYRKKFREDIRLIMAREPNITEFAEKLGVSHAILYCWWHGQYVPGDVAIVKMVADYADGLRKSLPPSPSRS